MDMSQQPVGGVLMLCIICQINLDRYVSLTGWWCFDISQQPVGCVLMDMFQRPVGGVLIDMSLLPVGGVLMLRFFCQIHLD